MNRQRVTQLARGVSPELIGETVTALSMFGPITGVLVSVDFLEVDDPRRTGGFRTVVTIDAADDG